MPMLIEPGAQYQEHIDNKDANYIQIPYETDVEEKLISLRDQLITAEEHNRGGDKTAAIELYHKLAEQFFNEYKNF